jgi:hypothetical protein
MNLRRFHQYWAHWSSEHECCAHIPNIYKQEVQPTYAAAENQNEGSRITKVLPTKWILLLLISARIFRVSRSALHFPDAKASVANIIEILLEHDIVKYHPEEIENCYIEYLLNPHGPFSFICVERRTLAFCHWNVIYRCQDLIFHCSWVDQRDLGVEDHLSHEVVFCCLMMKSQL